MKESWLTHLRWLPGLPFVDEALAIREARRARRWLLTSGIPLLYALGTTLLPWSVVPALASAMAGGAGSTSSSGQPRWMFLPLAFTVVGGGMATAFARVSQLWHGERLRQTLEGWLLAQQPPGPVVVTATLSGALPALLVSLPATILLTVMALLLGITPAATLLTLGLLILGTGLAAAGATASFLVAIPRSDEGAPPTPRRAAWRSALRPRSSALIPALLFLLVLGLWLRIEMVEHGWGRAWEEHPGRLLLAGGLLTPIPVLLGFADRRWWVYRVVERLDFPITPETVALLLLIGYAVAALFLLRWSEAAYRRLQADPECLQHSGAIVSGEGEIVATGSHGYWAGFANPVWTRELRTRLRGREAPQFIFFASVVLAIGGFTPLVAAASQLGDPLATAHVARDVFFWLGMTLFAMVMLISPGLTAEAIGTERARGTLELLLSTPLPRRRILSGKLLGDLSVLALLVSPSLPLFGFCYLFHGASGVQVVGVFLVLAMTTVICAIFGVTASALQKRTMAAKWQAYLLSLACCCFYGGPIWLMAALAAAGADLSSAGGFIYLAPLLLMLYGYVLAVLWAAATARLDYLEE